MCYEPVPEQCCYFNNRIIISRKCSHFFLESYLPCPCMVLFKIKIIIKKKAKVWNINKSVTKKAFLYCLFRLLIPREEKLLLYLNASIKLKLIFFQVRQFDTWIIDLLYAISNSVLFFLFPFVLIPGSIAIVKFK